MNFKTNNSIEIGKAGVERFIKIAESHNLNITMTNSEEDRIGHCDLEISKEGINYHRRIDVKGLKRINRRDLQQQSDWICIEFQGITGYPGWLYGKADIIAFETEEGFILINREVLVKYAEKCIDLSKEPIKSPKTGKKLFTLYQRYGRQDKFAFIPLSSIVTLKETVIWKEKK